MSSTAARSNSSSPSLNSPKAELQQQSNQSNTSNSRSSNSSTTQTNQFQGIQVICRVRCFNSTEMKTKVGRTTCLSIGESSIAVVTEQGGHQTQRLFTFDRILPPNMTQKDVFEVVGHPIVEHCYQGYNATIFAYGQTGSGKTYTIFGPKEQSVQQLNEESGIGPRILQLLYNKLEEQKEFNCYTCTCTMVQIYNETVTDLLNPNGKRLSISQGKGTSVIEGVSLHPASNLSEALQLLETGSKEREVGQTLLNVQSSRSHLIFTLTLETEQNEFGILKTRRSRLNIVDLAGSERFNTAQSQGIHFTELKYINKSLTQLNHVIKQLSDNEKQQKKGSFQKLVQHIDFRSSKLTSLLKDSLSGQSLCTFLVCVSPSKIHSTETWQTLEFAKRAKNIKVKPIKNEVVYKCEEEQDLRRSIQTFNQYLQERNQDTTSVTDACNQLSKKFGPQLEASEKELLQNALKQAEDARQERDSLRSQVNQLNEQVKLIMPGVVAGTTTLDKVQELFTKATSMEKNYDECWNRFDQYTADVAKMIRSLMGKIQQLQAADRREKFEELTQFWDQKIVQSEWLAAQQENNKLLKQIIQLKNLILQQQEEQANIQPAKRSAHQRHRSDGCVQQKRTFSGLSSILGRKNKVSLECIYSPSVSSATSKRIEKYDRLQEASTQSITNKQRCAKPLRVIHSKAPNSPEKQETDEGPVLSGSNSPRLEGHTYSLNDYQISQFEAMSITDTIIEQVDENELSDKESVTEDDQCTSMVSVAKITKSLQSVEVDSESRPTLSDVTQSIQKLKNMKHLRQSMATQSGELKGFLKLQQTRIDEEEQYDEL